MCRWCCNRNVQSCAAVACCRSLAAVRPSFLPWARHVLRLAAARCLDVYREMLHRTIGSIVPVHQCKERGWRWLSDRILNCLLAGGANLIRVAQLVRLPSMGETTFSTFWHPNITRHCPVQAAVVPSDPSRVTPRGSGLCVLCCLWGECSRGVLLTLGLQASSCLTSPRLLDSSALAVSFLPFVA